MDPLGGLGGEAALQNTAVEIVLVRPSRAANVAAACRAMKNMGLRRLCLVGVPPGFVTGEDRNLAYGAWEVLDAARHAGSLREAVVGAGFVAATSGRPGAHEVSPRALAREAAARPGSLAVVFGPEATGLTNEELALCHARVRIPADPEHPSLNLAQAVLVVAYELHLAAGGAPAMEAPPPAPAGALEEMLDELRAGLLGIGYLNPANPDAILGELRRLLARAGPDAREVALLRGLARQVRWAAAAVAGARAASDNPARPAAARSGGDVSELRVPTVAMAAALICADGREFRGRIFVPTSSQTHDGPMRAEEWMNAGGRFFPFLPDEGSGPVIFNKSEVLAVSVASESERPLAERVDIDRTVVIECGGRAFEGHLHIDMPPHHSRVLDYLNRGDGFVALHDRDRVHLLQKQNITRVIEARQG